VQKKVIIILAIVVVLLIGGGVWWFGKGQGNPSPVVPGGEEPLSRPTDKLSSSNTKTWNDPAGFTFEYSSGLAINNHPEDQINYANLEITSIGKTGSILIMAGDTKLKKIADWEKTQTKSEITTLGGKEAKKITLNTGETEIGAIDSGILFTIKMNLSSDSSLFWSDSFDQIIKSFTFVYPTTAPSSAGGDGSSEIIEEEEVIQ
jgi:hypothetical protein